MATATAVELLYRIDIGFDPERGYAAVVMALHADGSQRQRGIKANSMEQLTLRLRQALNEDTSKRKRFPLEHERGLRVGKPVEQSPIIQPGDRLFG